MKAIVISNCATKAYYQYLTALVPDWEVRSVVKPQAEKWLEAGHEGFLEYLGQVDVFVGLPNLYAKQLKRALNPQAQRILIPPFAYTGNRLDCFSLANVAPPTGAGVIHSRIALKSDLEGQTVAQTLSQFCDTRFEAEGYYDPSNRQRDALLSLHAAEGIDLTKAFDNWHREGDFQHTINHPEVKVFFDILLTALHTAGLNTRLTDQELTHLRSTSEDYLADNIIWPIYPEIAARRGIQNPKTLWRAVIARQEASFDLEEMLRRSFASYKATPNLQQLVDDALAVDINRI
jgi:hypothetical protein